LIIHEFVQDAPSSSNDNDTKAAGGALLNASKFLPKDTAYILLE
jgi:hypothetical protein